MTEQRPRDEVAAFIMDDALRTAERAEKSLEFISHPLWRTYVFCYAGGEALLERLVRGRRRPAAHSARRFFRLLSEQLTPSGIAAEISRAGPSSALTGRKSPQNR